MTRPTACVIFNPASGKKDTHPAAETLMEQVAADPRVVLRKIGKPGSVDRVVKQAIADGFTTIIAAGGDGTICGVTACLVDTDITLGVIPMGTFNFVARGLSIPEDIAKALDVALSGDTVRLTVGQVNDRIFLNNASLGAYATVLNVREGVYKRWGRSRMAAYWSVIKAMLTLYHPLRMTVTVDGKVYHQRSPMAFVASSAYQLNQYGFDGADAVQNGKLALILAPDTNRVRLLWHAVKILFGGIHRGEDYLMHIGEQIEIETKHGHRLVARDGENESMGGPFRFSVRRDAVKVRVPSGDAS